MTLRRLDVPASQWRRQDIAEVRTVLADVSADPAQSRDWRGSVVLSFSDVEEIHPYVNPAIAGFLRKLYSEIPYLLYFLYPDRASGALDGFFASLDALCRTEEGVWILWSDEVGTALYRALAEAAEFAINRGDDWVAVVKGYQYGEGQSVLKEIRPILISRGALLE